MKVTHTHSHNHYTHTAACTVTYHTIDLIHQTHQNSPVTIADLVLAQTCVITCAIKVTAWSWIEMKTQM